MATVRTADVLGAALKLPRKERARVAHELLISLDGASDPDPDWEEAWTVEIERRSREVREGTAKLVDAEAVFREVRAQLKSARSKKRATARSKPRSRRAK